MYLVAVLDLAVKWCSKRWVVSGKKQHAWCQYGSHVQCHSLEFPTDLLAPWYKTKLFDIRRGASDFAGRKVLNYCLDVQMWIYGMYITFEHWTSIFTSTNLQRFINWMILSHYVCLISQLLERSATEHCRICWQFISVPSGHILVWQNGVWKRYNKSYYQRVFLLQFSTVQMFCSIQMQLAGNWPNLRDIFSWVPFNPNQLEQDPMMQLIIVTLQIEWTRVHWAPAKDRVISTIYIYM